MKKIRIRIATASLALIPTILSSDTAAQVTKSFTEPFERIEVSAAELGIIDAVKVGVGQAVRTGDLLGQLNSGVLFESRRLAKQRAESTARLDAARADLKLKEGMYAKLAPLLKSGHANPSEIDRSQTEFEQAHAAFRIAGDEMIEAKIELARIDAQLLERQIRSPIDGIVIDIHRKPGEYLPASDPRFATVVDVSKLRSRFFVSTGYAEQLQRGQSISILLGAKQLKATALIEFVSPITESESGTVRVDVLLDNSDHKYRSGVSCVIVAAPKDELNPIPVTGDSLTRTKNVLNGRGN